MTCLVTGASFSLDGYYHGVLIEPFFMSYDGGDNNNGITIFDITEPSDVRYCFVDFLGMESEREVDLNMPLTARTYLAAYPPLDDADADEAGFLPLVESFEGRKLITLDALAETWSDGAWDTESINESNRDLADVPKPKSLRDQSMDRLLDQLLDPSKEQEQYVQGLIAEADHLHGFILSLRQRLYSQALDLEPSSTNIQLLHKALEGETILDLNTFKMWSAEHLVKLVKGNNNIKTLILSNMPDLTESELKTILSLEDSSATISIDTVVVLEAPNISLDFMTKHLGNYDVYHTELFRRALYNPYQTIPRDQESVLPALQFDAPETPSQLVWVGIPGQLSNDPRFRLPNGTQFDWDRMKFSAQVPFGYNGGKEPTISYMNILLDIPLSAAKTIQSLRRLLQYMPSFDSYFNDDIFRGAAGCFATTSVLNDDGCHSIGPLSQTLAEHNQRYRPSNIENGKDHYLKPGHWAIVLIHEAFDAGDQAHLDRQASGADDTTRTFKPLKRLRYMLAQANPLAGPSTPRFVTVDVPGYIACVVKDPGQAEQMKAWWVRESLGLPDGTAYYDDSDAQAIVERVYSKEGFGQCNEAQS
ncbi:MAG: hypothetical protein Q9226_002789 [Calogaya cf. arnoldii]